jgi:hypothetical protein
MARLIGLAAVASGLIVAGLLLLALVHDRLPGQTVWQTKLQVLRAVEVTYLTLLAAALAATPLLGVGFIRARRRGIARPHLARLLLFGVAVLVGAGLGELGASYIQPHLEAAGILALPPPAKRAEPFALPRTSPELALPQPPPRAAGDALRLVVIGESSAAGVPFNLFGLSIGSLVAWQLEEALPGRQIELFNLADSGETLERQHRRLAALNRRPDALIVYCGHNEFSSRMPWSREVPHYMDGPAQPLFDRLVAEVERISPFCGLIRQSVDTCRIAIPPPRGGYRVLVDQPAYTPAEYARLLTDFRTRLESIVAWAEAVAAVPVLIIPPANDAGFEPNRSFLRADARQAERDAFARRFVAARRLESTDSVEALKRYGVLVDRHPEFAETHFRLARLLEASGVWDEAYRHDVAARDGDGLPMRCPTAFQEAYRAVAARHRVILIDGQAYFRRLGRHRLLGDDLFMDAMHPSLRGQLALAQAVLQGLHARRALGWPEAADPPVLDPARCAARFGLGPNAWEKLCRWGAMVYDLLSSGPHDPSARRARREEYQAAAERIARGTAPEALGLPNVGIPAVVPLDPDAAVWTQGAEPPRG